MGILFTRERLKIMYDQRLFVSVPPFFLESAGWGPVGLSCAMSADHSLEVLVHTLEVLHFLRLHEVQGLSWCGKSMRGMCQFFLRRNGELMCKREFGVQAQGDTWGGLYRQIARQEHVRLLRWWGGYLPVAHWYVYQKKKRSWDVMMDPGHDRKGLLPMVVKRGHCTALHATGHWVRKVAVPILSPPHHTILCDKENDHAQAEDEKEKPQAAQAISSQEIHST